MEESQEPHRSTELFPAKRLVWMGWICLCCSSSLLYASVQLSTKESLTLSALLMMAARIFGIGAFLAGAIALFNHWWVHGTMLFVGSVGLPMISLFFYGYL